MRTNGNGNNEDQQQQSGEAMPITSKIALILLIASILSCLIGKIPFSVLLPCCLLRDERLKAMKSRGRK